jgi:hypothetical protein
MHIQDYIPACILPAQDVDGVKFARIMLIIC